VAGVIAGAKVTYKPFNKNMTITPHAIDAQLERLRDLIKKRDEIEKQAWVDTVEPGNEATAFDDLDECRKQEIKRDKWNRSLE
jgi:hypothetical protein